MTMRLTIQEVAIVVSPMLITILVSQIPIIWYYNEKLPVRGTTPGIDFETCRVDDESVTFPDATFADFCSRFSPLIQDELFYNICLTNSFTLLQSINVFISLLNNKQCSNSVSPFISNGTHLLCGDGNSIAVNIQERCVQIHNYNCTVEWRTLENIFDVPLPGHPSFTISENVTFSEAPFLNCPDEFDMYCGSFCLPSCRRLSQITWNSITIISDNVIIALIALSLLGGISVCILKRRKMVKIYSMEYKKWQEKSQKQFDEILALQQKISKKEGELLGMRNETSNLHHQLKQQHDMLNIKQTDRQTMQNTVVDKVSTLQEGTEMYKDESTRAKNSMSQQNVEKLSMKQQLINDETEEVKSDKQVKARDGALGVINKEKQTSLTNSNKEGMNNWERPVVGNSGLTQRHNHNFQIIQKNCEEVCNDQLQMYKEMYVPQLSSKKETMIMKIARTYDEERAYRIYISRITMWREETSLAFEPPKHKFNNKIQIMAMEIKKKVFINKSPEEEACKNAIKKCLHNRDQLITQLYTQLCKQI